MDISFNQVLKIIMGIGIPAIICGCVLIGRKLQILDTLKDTTDKVKHNIKVIADCLVKAPVQFDSEKLQTYSPLQLTDKGTKYLNDIGFIKIFKENEKDFFEFIDTEKPTTKYDTEISATKSFLILFERDYFKPIKEFLYTHPQDSLQAMSKIAGVYVRDSYLKNHSEITK